MAVRTTPSPRAAQARLARLLNKTDAEGIPIYGEMLAKLGVREQREVLDLIEAGQPQGEVIGKLTELDTQRRQRRSTRDRARRYSRLPEPERIGEGRPTDETTEFWRYYAQLRAA